MEKTGKVPVGTLIHLFQIGQDRLSGEQLLRPTLETTKVSISPMPANYTFVINMTLRRVSYLLFNQRQTK